MRLVLLCRNQEQIQKPQMTLIDHPTGNYRFLPGIASYSCGVVSAPGFEVVHVTLQQALPWRIGFERIARFLEAEGRPKAALCAIELRSPRPFTFPGFAAFNAEYATVLETWGLFVEGVNPVARTNVAPELVPPVEPMLHGFSCTKPLPADSDLTATGIVAGAGELPEGVLTRECIVARGDTSPQGIATKARFVMDLMEQRLRRLGLDWPQVSAINVYTIHPIAELLPEVILGRTRNGGMQSMHWHYTRPPIEGIEYEMDVRCVRTDLQIV